MPSRTFHRKSRHGCLTCKQRKKRCDLCRPMCGDCQRLSLKCVFQDSIPLNKVSGHHTRILTPCNILFNHPLQSALAQRPRLTQGREYFLAAHYLRAEDTRLYGTIPGLTALRRLDFANLDRRYPYLLDGILAAAALCIASGETAHTAGISSDYREQASIYQQSALSSYVKSLSAINHKSCQYIFGFSIILVGLELAFLSRQVATSLSNSQAISFIDSVVEIFRLMRGAVAVANESSRWIMTFYNESRLLPIHNLLQQGDLVIDMDVSNALDALVARICTSQNRRNMSYAAFTQGSDQETVYLTAIQQLRGAFGCLDKAEPDNFKVVIGWIAFVDPSFVDMLQARQPIALVILAYFGVALNELRSVWWLEHTGLRMILAVDRILHKDGAEEWYAFSEWSMSRLLRPEACRKCYTPPLPVSCQNRQLGDPFEIAYGRIDSLGIHERKFC